MSTQAEAQAEADKLVAVLGEGWTAKVWENFGWHYNASHEAAGLVMHVSYHGERDHFTTSYWVDAHVKADLGLSTQIWQRIGRGATPLEALGDLYRVLDGERQAALAAERQVGDVLFAMPSVNVHKAVLQMLNA